MLVRLLVGTEVISATDPTDVLFHLGKASDIRMTTPWKCEQVIAFFILCLKQCGSLESNENLNYAEGRAHCHDTIHDSNVNLDSSGFHLLQIPPYIAKLPGAPAARLRLGN